MTCWFKLGKKVTLDRKEVVRLLTSPQVLKSINIKIPLTIAQRLDDRGQLNPQYISQFITTFSDSEVPKLPISELTYNYTLKVNADLHKKMKIRSIENNLPMNEMLGRLLVKYY